MSDTTGVPAAEQPARVAKLDDNEEKIFKGVEEEYMPHIRERLREMLLARRTDGRQLDFRDTIRTFEEFFNPLLAAAAPRSRRTWFEENAFIVVVALMTLFFGVFGLFPSIFPVIGTPNPQTASFLDIAKIFAGAVVGGAAGSAVASRRKDS